MSNLFRNSVNGNGAPPRPKPRPVLISDVDEQPLSSDSSSSSADSAASIITVRPSSREQSAPSNYWTSYFSQELFLNVAEEGRTAEYHVYLTPPTNPERDPLFICHHGAGSTGLSFALFANEIRNRLPSAGILSLDARGHGSIAAASPSGEPNVDYSIQTLASDALRMITLTKEKMGWPSIPPSVLVGHSLGGAVITELAANFALGTALIGFCVIDVVEGSAIEALSHMKTYLSSRPSVFNTVDDAIQWHIRSRTIRNAASAAASVPSLLTQLPSGKYIWKTDLNSTAPWWEGWFTGMSEKFLRGQGAKMLILAGTDRLDKELMIGQMQGKFQLVVLPEAGHFVQEDVPEKAARLLVEFYKRNDRSGLVLPPKVSDLLAQGKKV